MKPEKTRVLLVDDHMIVRLGLQEALESEYDIEVVGALANGEDVIEAYQRLRPDIVLMDYRLTGITGVEATKNLRAKEPEALVLFMSVYDGVEDLGQAVDAGAKGYLPKSVETREIVEAIEEITSGGNYFPARLAKKIANRQQTQPLSKREKEVLQLLVDGYSNKEIGEKLGISFSTAKLHVSNLLIKLDVMDRTQAAVKAVRDGFVHLDD